MSLLTQDELEDALVELVECVIYRPGSLSVRAAVGILLTHDRAARKEIKGQAARIREFERQTSCGYREHFMCTPTGKYHCKSCAEAFA